MAAPLRRTKTSRAIVEYVEREIFEGRLRPGDRIEVDRITAALGVSPTPVREALVLLERDGLVTSQVHRRAFVEYFDARTLRADFQVLGLLSGVAVARVAKDRDPAVLAELRGLLDELRATPPDQRARMQELATEILRAQHRAGATPRLRAELRGFSGFLQWAAGRSDRRSHAEVVDGQARVIDAIATGASRQASQHRVADARAAGEEVIRDLVQRGVLADDGTASHGAGTTDGTASGDRNRADDGNATDRDATHRRGPNDGSGAHDGRADGGGADGGGADGGRVTGGPMAREGR